MVNYIIFPDLYKGSALLDITRGLEKEIKKYNLNIKLIKFSGRLKEIKSGDLDEPEIFFNHNVKTVKKLRKLLSNGDKVLFVDFFQPCLELLKYYLDGRSIKIKFGSLFHGASFVKGDYFENRNWMKNFDLGILEIMDVVYAPSYYTAKLFDRLQKKVKVFPFGFNPDEFKYNLDKNKSYDVIIPHRWGWDRDPSIVNKIINSLPEVKFAISGYGRYSKDKKLKEMFLELTKKKNVVDLGIKSGETHYKDLVKSKIVFATKDSFGYSIRKAISCGCIPVAREDYSYPEFLDRENLFNNIEEAKMKIKYFLKRYPKDYKRIKKTEFRKILKDFF